MLKPIILRSAGRSVGRSVGCGPSMTEAIRSGTAANVPARNIQHAKDFSGNSSSGSQISASKLIADFCEADASSGANLSVNCIETFKANASSGGHIKNHESSIKTVVNSSSGGRIDTKN